MLGFGLGQVGRGMCRWIRNRYGARQGPGKGQVWSERLGWLQGGGEAGGQLDLGCAFDMPLSPAATSSPAWMFELSSREASGLGAWGEAFVVIAKVVWATLG